MVNHYNKKKKVKSLINLVKRGGDDDDDGGGLFFESLSKLCGLFLSELTLNNYFRYMYISFHIYVKLNMLITTILYAINNHIEKKEDIISVLNNLTSFFFIYLLC